MLKELLEGKPFRHPLHPFLVHFPVGLFVLSLVLDLASLAAPGVPALVPGAFYTMLLGVLTALMAAIPGFVDYSEIRRDRPGKRVATAHMILNLLMVAVYGVNLGMRALLLEASPTPSTPLVLSAIGVSLLTVSGYLGGHLIYAEGISVGRHRRNSPLPEETLRFSGADPSNAPVDTASGYIFVPTIPADHLRNKETLRLQIDNKALVLAKIEGHFYAFQEFCTHRFGPLSEGSFHKDEVQCPWHGSCFDARTGRVTQGPAKADLKTYPGQLRDGKVCVGIRPDSAAAENIEPRKKAA
jgi:nitrite reductase/ring-hydroxylating ferredoxin subunit/uncharacterized membrane protein